MYACSEPSLQRIVNVTSCLVCWVAVCFLIYSQVQPHTQLCVRLTWKAAHFAECTLQESAPAVSCGHHLAVPVSKKDKLLSLSPATHQCNRRFLPSCLARPATDRWVCSWSHTCCMQPLLTMWPTSAPYGAYHVQSPRDRRHGAADGASHANDCLKPCRSRVLATCAVCHVWIHVDVGPSDVVVEVLDKSLMLLHAGTQTHIACIDSGCWHIKADDLVRSGSHSL